MAARLTYHFWQAPPDDQLWTAAQNGSLLDPNVYGAELDRLVQSPLARASVDELALQWLRLEELPPLDALNADPVFKAFAGSQLPPASARQAMIGTPTPRTTTWQASTRLPRGMVSARRR